MYGGLLIHVGFDELGPDGSHKGPVTLFGYRFSQGIFHDHGLVKTIQGIRVQLPVLPSGQSRLRTILMSFNVQNKPNDTLAEGCKLSRLT
ncbi:hypothetical protein NPIL_88541 [Nephila pilipes]|uniref:Uncharacterized protein n=1 Tax=Nephila pilipes TaxID=299642 RepID=A0A8X6QL10_NEPPI|nr:hypothetical protein NPIL_88541 [Nephila pilipes]